jgi:hypothetical protein
LISQCKFDDTRALINSELDTLRQRNKILKIADRHGWDTATKKVLWVKSARILEAWSLSFATCPNNSSPELGGILVVVSQRIIKVLVNSVPTMAVWLRPSFYSQKPIQHTKLIKSRLFLL